MFLTLLSCFCAKNITEPINMEMNNINIKEIPLDIEWKDIPKFVPDVSYGRVIKVYDADTITIATWVMDELYKFPVRLIGVDTPEIKPKKPSKDENIESYENEKKMAKMARDELALMIYKNIVRLEDVSYDKYGRLLAKVYYDDICINEWLIEKRFAVKYDGGTKISPKCWVEYYKNDSV